jgi:hypothetical protein
VRVASDTLDGSGGFSVTKRTLLTIAAIVVLALLGVGALVTQLGVRGSQSTSSSSPSGTGTSTAASGSAQPTDTWYPSTGDRIAYARAIGGVSHQGQTLYVILAATEKTEAAARARLDAAIPKFGDTELYYIVQKSDNFSGLSPGQWIVIESYREKAHAMLKENLDFGRLVGPDARVVKVAVKTSEPIPVFEDLGPSDTTATPVP